MKKQTLPIVFLFSITITLCLITFIGCGLFLYLFNQASTEQIYFFQTFDWFFSNLYTINIALLILFVFTLLFLIFWGYQRYHAKEFGIRLIIKIALFFTAIACVPSLLMYSISYYYVGQSFKNFFKTEQQISSLHAASTLENALFERLLNEQRAYAFDLNKLLQAVKTPTVESLSNAVKKLDQAAGTHSLALIQSKINYANEQENAQAGDQSIQNTLLYGGLHQLSNNILEQAKNKKAYAEIEQAYVPQASGHYNFVLRLRVLLPINEPANYFLQVVQIIPKTWMKAAEQLNRSKYSYNHHQKVFQVLQQLYFFMMLISFLFVLALAIMMAHLLGKQIIQPLLVMENSTKNIDESMLSSDESINLTLPPTVIQPNDDLGFLTQAFNHMIQRLHSERAKAQKGNEELEALLGTMSSGILLFNQSYRILKYNPVAEEILGIKLANYLNHDISHPSNRLYGFYQKIEHLFENNYRWEKQQEYAYNRFKKHLLLRGSVLVHQNVKTYILVFDDISQVISAEKSAAWAEVAQRLAHEIKNPLTPIQLSAERLQIKLLGKLSEPKLDSLLQKSTDTIIQQVNALKKLVDEFRHYARLPQAQFQAIQLNDLIKEVMQLYLGIEHIQWRMELQDELPLVKIDPEQIRQVLHNLIKNAQEAMQNQDEQTIIIRTKLQKDDIMPQSIQLSIEDRGGGFAPQVIAKVFEPYITTKATGTGLGMAIVKKILDENQAKISIQNIIDNQYNLGIIGAEIQIWFKLFQEEEEKRNV